MAKLSLYQLRTRHSTCISWGDIRRDIANGYVPYDPKYGPSCSYPEDGLCAHPNTPDDVIIERMNDKTRETN